MPSEKKPYEKPMISMSRYYADFYASSQMTSMWGPPWEQPWDKGRLVARVNDSKGDLISHPFLRLPR